MAAKQIPIIIIAKITMPKYQKQPHFPKPHVRQDHILYNVSFLTLSSFHPIFYYLLIYYSLPQLVFSYLLYPLGCLPWILSFFLLLFHWILEILFRVISTFLTVYIDIEPAPLHLPHFQQHKLGDLVKQALPYLSQPEQMTVQVVVNIRLSPQHLGHFETEIQFILFILFAQYIFYDINIQLLHNLQNKTQIISIFDNIVQYNIIQYNINLIINNIFTITSHNNKNIYINVLLIIIKFENMQKLFYVVCRWLEEEESKQAQRICGMIKNDMQQLGFRYDDIRNTEMQRQQLFRQRQQLIKEKERLQQQKRQIQLEKQNNLRLMQEKKRLERQKQQLQQKQHQIDNLQDGDTELKEQKQTEQIQMNEQQREAMEAKRRAMLEQFENLKNEREKIIEQRKILYQRMEKIEKLQKLQRLYQQELNRLRGEDHTEQGQREESKETEEQSRQMNQQSEQKREAKKDDNEDLS